MKNSIQHLLKIVILPVGHMKQICEGVYEYITSDLLSLFCLRYSTAIQGQLKGKVKFSTLSNSVPSVHARGQLRLMTTQFNFLISKGSYFV